MKQVLKKSILSICAVLFLAACTNDEWSFPDYDYTATYFPWQFPVRTLILGESDYDNTNDKNGRFVISAAMGGVYENKKDQIVEFVIDPTLVENLRFKGTTTAVKILPQEYYTLSSSNQIIIPKGKVNGGVTVQLTPAFFADPLAISTNYVIPMVIVNSTTDSVLNGLPLIDNADRRIAADWKVSPKNFTLFGIKYINEYHGKYLMRGKTIVKNASDVQIDQVIYRQAYVEKDIITPLTTSERYAITHTQPIRVSAGSSPGNYKAKITVDSNGNCTVSKPADGAFDVTGTGKFVKEGDQWGGKKRNVFYLNYQVTANSNTYVVTDTLVFRDNGVAVEEFTPEVAL